jgi:hypothetical protein
VARQMGSSARVVVLHNLTHVTAEGVLVGCASSIYRAFVADPSDLATMDTSCAKNVAEIHTVPTNPMFLSQVIPATPLPGDTADRRVRQAAAVAVAAVGDEISRWPFVFASSDTGLRGGMTTFSGDSTVIMHLHHVRWVNDATVDGTARWRGDSATAHLVVRTGGLTLRLTASWDPFGSLAFARVVGSAGGMRLLAQLPAP